MSRPYWSIWSFIIACAALFSVSPASAANLSNVAHESVQWDHTAAQAIAALQQGDTATNEAPVWGILRSTLATQRDRALALSESTNIDLKILSAQLESLGSAPAAGKIEAGWIADRRKILEQKISEARAPIITSQNAYLRANVLIVEIDKRINQARRIALLARGPSPLLPTGWIALPSDFRNAGYRISAALRSAGTAEHFASALPLVALLVIAGLGLAVIVQRPVLSRLDQGLASPRSRGSEVFLLFLRDLASLFIPAIGLLLILVAVSQLFPDSSLSAQINAVLVLGGGIVIFAMWLGRSLFSPRLPHQRFIVMTDGDALRACRLTIALGVVLAIEIAMEQLVHGLVMSPGGASVLSFLVVLASSILLWMMAIVLRQMGDGDGAAQPGHAIDFRRYTVQAMKLVALASAVLAAAGYIELSHEALLPTLLTLGTIALGILTFKRTMAISAAIFGHASAEQRHSMQLLPVLYGFIIIMVSAPLIALIWGVRAAELGDAMSALKNGVEVGSFRISAGDVLMFGFVFLIGYALTRLVQRLIQASILSVLDIDKGVQAALITGIGYVGLTISALVAITSAGLDLSSLAIVAGALSVGVGLGLQSVVSNFVSGIILLIERPVKVGDWVDVAGHAGIVAKISVRSTRLRTVDRDDVIIPNSELIAGVVRNRTYANNSGRIDLRVGIAYGSDTHIADTILRGAALAHPEVEKLPAPTVLLEEFGDSALVLRLLCFVDDVSRAVTIESDLRFAIYKQLSEAGISLPFPQREVTLRSVVETPKTA